MEYKIKKKYLDTKISCPLTKKEVILRFVDEKLYEYYYNHGYKILFERNGNNISKSRN